jgi:hypothetical protein
MATPVQPVPVLVNRARNGKLNSDTDILELKEGNYPDRVNVEFNADGELFSDTPALGNKDVCSLGLQQVEQQKTRIYIDVNAFFNSIVIQFYNKNGQLIREYFGSAASQTLQGMKDAIASAIRVETQDYWYFVGFDNEFTLEPYIDVTIYCAYSDYTLILTDNNGNVLRNDDIREAISITGQGGFIEIGSKDLLGTTWLFSTTQDREQTSIYFASMSMYLHNDYGGQIAIYFPDHGLVSGESIVVANATDVGAIANGEWVVNVLDENNFALFLSITTGITLTNVKYGGIIYKNTFGLGQIGVQQYVGETDSYTYTKILASKRFNFRTMYQIDADAVLNNNGYLLKFTDNYNYPRTFSYRGAFIEDGALQPINPDGYYTYETLTEEIKNIINYSAAVVEYEEQVQTSGSVPPANWRYGVLFYTDTNATTELSFLSNPIPTFAPTYIGYSATYHPIYGNSIENNITTKINRVRVTGITPGIFKYIELIGFNYPNSGVNSIAVNAFRIRKVLLAPDQTQIVLEHNGNEPDITFYDTTIAIPIRPDIIRAGSNRFCENRLVYGNITTSTAIDIRDWALTMKYSIKRKAIFAAFRTEMWEEFYNPENTAKYVGYQPYEWYRFYISAETYSGKITDSVFCFDMRFLTQADYASFGESEFNEINGGDRRNPIGDEYDSYAPGIWTATERYLYQIHIELNNIDWDYQIDGVKVKDIFKSVKISRAERVNEVIASGVFVGGVSRANFAGGTGQRENDFIGIADVAPAGYKPQFGSFYSPDILFGYTQYNQFIQGDELINFSGLDLYTRNRYDETGTNPYSYSYWCTFAPTNKNFPFISQRTKITDCKYIDQGSVGTIAVNGVNISFYKNYFVNDNTGSAVTQSFRGSPVLSVDTPLENNTGYANVGKYQSLIFRSKKDKYGTRESIGSTIVFTGATIYNGQSSVSVFGGDVFNQQVQFRQLKRDSIYSRAFAINIISTNTVNTNLRQYTPDSPFRTFPVYPILPEEWVKPANLEIEDYYYRNTGYSIFNQAQASTVFDPEGNNLGNYITRKYYSQLNPNNANTDKYREFLPLDFQDNPNNFGPITHLEIVNGELFTLQQRGFTREFFNATGRLQTAEDGDVLIGTGEVLSRKGLRLTMLGTNQKWSVCKGFTFSGKETIMWVNDEFGCVMRFGADGTVNVSEREMMSTFFRERMRFVIGKDTPADNQGITTVWDNIGKNFIITQRAWKDSPEWVDGTSYTKNKVVTSYDEQTYGIKIQIETKGVVQLYLCLSNHIASSSNQPGTAGGEEYWEAISLENLDYYNVYTIVFNEQKNSFTHRYTFYPRIYHTQNNRYFSQSPIDFPEISSLPIYRHRDKDAREITFYGQANEGYTEYIINYMSRTVKKFIAHAQTALLKPKRVEFETQFISQNGIDNRKTYLDRADFTMRENQAFSNIKNNLDSQGRNDQTTAPMTGLWLKIRTFFAANEKQKINDTTVVIRTGQRNVENP